jgi:type VI secretion system protein VasG
MADSRSALGQLLKRANPALTKALLAATKDARRRHHEEVYFDHLLNQLLGMEPGDVHAILHYYNIPIDSLKSQVLRSLGAYPRVAGAAARLSKELQEAIEGAWRHANKWGQEQIRTGNIFVAYLSQVTDRDTRVLRMLAPINLTELQMDFPGIVSVSSENRDAVVAVPAEESAGKEGAAPAAQSGEGDAISRFCKDFTELARNNNFDPILGRDQEIQLVLDILARRRKNNPILIGEAGVGKTAVVEGLAQRIASGDVPRHFSGARLIELDVGLLQAGASVKGEFEKRLKNLINEVRSSAQPTILFIDEAHNLIGAGSTAGVGDAANLLKPALARGELHAIAATTWSEYKKFFEKDPALSRRFQPVLIQEPSEEVAITMLRGVRERFERDHGVRILDDAVVAAVTLGHRFVAGRNLPDIAVDLIDTAAAKIKNIMQSKPPEIDLLERELADIQLAIATLKRERAEGRSGMEDEIAELEASSERLKEKHAALSEQWAREREIVDELSALKNDLLTQNEALTKAREDLDHERIAEIQQEIDRLTAHREELVAQLAEVQGDHGLIRLEVDREIISKIVSELTRIPVERMSQRNLKEEVAALPERLRERIKGQDYALSRITDALLNYYAGINDPNAPIGVFLCLGPSGNGKTETGVALADIVFGGEHYLNKINMSEYSEQFTTTRLIGSPPGYVGYGEGGVLTEAVRKLPYSVVLLDEVEKAHKAVWELFYDVFDRGELKDGEGRPINFRNTLIIMTSNVGSEIIEAWAENQRRMAEARARAAEEKGEAPEPLDEETRQAQLRELELALRAHAEKLFTAPLINRMTILPYLPLPDDVIREIAEARMRALCERLSRQKELPFAYDDSVVDYICARADAPTMGARLIKRIIDRQILPEVARFLVEQELDASGVTIRIGAEGDRVTVEAAS